MLAASQIKIAIIDLWEWLLVGVDVKNERTIDDELEPP